ncbi:MAG: DUF4091 domain-containing protein, partial [Armatimonadota bacterium]|nr:DUF4091 domain-containing protein [Armatimonadota bacterium]
AGQTIQRTERRALAVVGKGEESTYWRNTAWRLEPNRHYAFRVRLRGEGKGGCAIVGANVVNRDFIPTSEWQTAEYVFRAPADTRNAFIRVGHWRWQGEILFDQPQLIPVEVVHFQQGELTLGEGESIRGGYYRFISRFGELLSNAQAPLREFTATFNTNRWVFSPNAHVTYRHALDGLTIRRARLSLHVPYEADGGALRIEMRRDAEEWRAVHTIRGRGAHTLEVPAELLPARALEVRLVGQAGVIQVDSYILEAELANPPQTPLVGRSLALYPEPAPSEALEVKPVALQRDAQGRWRLLVQARAKVSPIRVQAFQEGKQGAQTPQPSPAVALAPEQPKLISIPLPEDSPESSTVLVGLRSEDGRALWKVRLATQTRFLEWAHYGYLLKGAPEWAGLWWCEWGWKVGRTRPLPTQTRTAVRLSAARGEYEPVQIVLRPSQPLRLLKVEVSDLKAGKYRIPAEYVEVREVAYVPVTYPTDRMGTPDDYPDPLPPLQLPMELAPGQNQPLWLTIYAPYGTPAATYKGTLQLHTNRGTLKVPIEFTVFNFDLPKVPTLRSGFGINAGRIFQYHKLQTDADKRAVWDLYMQAFRRARLAPYNFYLNWYGVRLEEGRVVLDFREFDAFARRYLDEFGFNSFVVPIYGLPGGRYPNYTQAEFLGFKEGTPEYERYWTDYMRQLEAHLRANGWLKKAYIYWFDEPEEADYPFVRRINEQIHRAAPGLTRMLTEQPEPELIGAVDLWCPLTASVRLETIPQRRRAGEEVWWYVCTGPRAPYVTLFIDHPGVEMRLWLWQTWKYGVQGVLIWETTYWHNEFAYPDRLQNPWEDPMSYVWDASFKPGTRQFWGNGDGRLLYPPRRDPNTSDEPVVAPPIPSIRWECLRDGAEDYEYFVLLERLVQQAERRGASPELLKQARALLRIPDTIVKSMTEFTYDPRVLNEHRRKVARMIERLTPPTQTAPRRSARAPAR